MVHLYSQAIDEQWSENCDPDPHAPVLATLALSPGYRHICERTVSHINCGMPMPYCHAPLHGAVVGKDKFRALSVEQLLQGNGGLVVKLHGPKQAANAPNSLTRHRC